jgi:3',5'-cyclic-AMP phosphodiesterase
MKLGLLFDLHLDLAGNEEKEEFFEEVFLEPYDAYIVGGDIADGNLSLECLKHLATLTKKMFYFILGNHDFYGTSIANVRKKASELIKKEKNLVYLTETNLIELSPTCCLIGHDGWTDGREGDFLGSSVVLRDYLEIEELRGKDPKELLKTLGTLAHEAKKSAEEKLQACLEKYKKVIFATHIPPFREVCVHEGKEADEDWAPHFVSKTMGQMLAYVMENNPEKELLVLCGHSHSSRRVKILPNLEVWTVGRPDRLTIHSLDVD